MAVNMSGIDKNPFRVGDKVKVKSPVLRAWPRAFKNYLPVKYAVVTKLDNIHVFTDVDDAPTHFEHFELYRESSEDVMKQQKTKRVPFSKAAWEKYKGVATPYYNENSAVSQLTYFEGSTTAFTLAGTVAGQLSRFYGSEIELEIPITTKRIPFNPELKGTKVFYGKTELIEWFYLRTGLVCGTYELVAAFKGMESLLYHPSDLEMEIDEEG